MFRLSIINVLYIGNNTKFREFRANVNATADLHIYIGSPNILYSFCQSTMRKLDDHFSQCGPERK